MAGTLTATTIQNDTSSPPTFRNNSVEIGRLCRAWVNFNGTGTPAIRDSFNVSSITDNGTGDYTVNFTTAMPNANYAVGATAGQVTSLGTWRTAVELSVLTTNSARIKVNSDNSGYVDVDGVTCAVFS